MKKIIKTLLVVMVLVLVVAAFTACLEKEPEPVVYEGHEGHNVSVIPAVAATCAKEGLTEGAYCVDCREMVVEQTKTEKVDHVWVDNEDRDFTCTLDGYKGGKHCGNCGIQDGNTEITKAHCVYGEPYVYQEPTCGVAGFYAMDCTVCGTPKRGEDIPATGEHNYTVEVEAQAPTCRDGYTAHKACEVCGAKNDEYEVLPGDKENGHHFAQENMFYYPSAPTCTEGAYIAGYCTYCENGYILEPVPATGHKDEDGDGICDVCEEEMPHEHTWSDATCTEPAKCECGEVNGEALGHTLVEGICTACGYVPNVFANKLFVGVGDAAANIYSSAFGYQTLTDGIIYEEGKGRFSSKQNGGKVEGIIDLGAVYDLDEFKVYIYWGGLEKLGTGFEIQVCFGGEWTTVISCSSIEEMQAYWVDNPDSVDKDWLVFDLGGVAARQVKFIIPGQTSAAWTTLYELECSARVSDKVEPEPEEPVFVENIFAGKTFNPTSDAQASVLSASWWKGSGYEGLTDGIKNADNAPGRFSTIMKATGMMDATIELGGEYELHSLKFYTYDPAAGTGATSLGANLLIQVYADGEWKDVVVCADNATLASYLVVNEGTFNDYLEFDLGGIKAEKVRFYISASASSSGTTYEEIECNGYAK